MGSKVRIDKLHVQHTLTQSIIFCEASCGSLAISKLRKLTNCAEHNNYYNRHTIKGFKCNF